MPRSRRRPAATPPSVPSFVLVWAAGLAVVALVAYGNSFHGPFVFDDVPGIVNNPSIQSLWPPARWLAAPPGSTPSGRPILNLSLALNYAMGGLDVRGYHGVSLIVHLAAGLALFGVARRTLLSDRLRANFAAVATPLAFAIGAVWVAHPLNTESVTYVVQRGESLAGLFLLLTLYCAIRGWTALAVAACALGMGSKETMIVAPALVALWDYTFRADGARRWRLYAALAATLAIVLVPMALSETQGRTAVSRLLGQTARAPGDDWTPWSYLWTQAGVIVRYVMLAFRPWPLVFDYYDWPPAHSPLDVLPQALMVVTLLAATIAALVRRHALGFLGAWFFLTLAPTSSVLPIPTEIAAEHRMYVPLAAIVSLAIVAVFVAVRAIVSREDAPPRLGRDVAWGALVLALVLAWTTRERNRDYVSAAALWGDTVEKRPGNARARINYGIELIGAGQYSQAEAQMRAALPLEMDPETRAQAQLQLGSAQSAQGRIDEGIRSIERAVQIDPSIQEADAILGQAYADQGKDALAVRHFLRAIERRPEMPLLLTRTAWLLATSRDPAVRDGERAAVLAERAIALTSGQDGVAHESAAAAYAELGRPADAVAAIDRALALSRARGDAQTSALYERQRAFYAAGGRVAK